MSRDFSSGSSKSIVEFIAKPISPFAFSSVTFKIIDLIPIEGVCEGISSFLFINSADCNITLKVEPVSRKALFLMGITTDFSPKNSFVLLPSYVIFKKCYNVKTSTTQNNVKIFFLRLSLICGITS